MKLTTPPLPTKARHRTAPAIKINTSIRVVKDPVTLLVKTVEVVMETSTNTSTVRKTVHQDQLTVTRATNTARETVTQALETVTVQTVTKPCKTVKGR